MGVAKSAPPPCAMASEREQRGGAVAPKRQPPEKPHFGAGPGKEGENPGVDPALPRGKSAGIAASSQGPARRIDVSLVCPKANNASTWAHHLSDKILLPNEFDGANIAIAIKLFDLAKLTGRNVQRIVGLLDHGLKELRFECIERINRHSAIIGFIKIVVPRQECTFELPQCTRPLEMDIVEPARWTPPHLWQEKLFATNKVPNAPYRGAGRPEAALATERAMDLVAGALRIKPAEVRRRNMIRPEQMPYKVGLVYRVYRDGEPIVYDGGDYPAALEKALAAVGGLDSFRQTQKAARVQGRYLGIGLGCYTEGTGAGPFEGATVRIETSGKIYIAGGACPQGQGMETIFAQIVADAWNVHPEDVIITLADTAAIPIGFGTIARRHACALVVLTDCLHTMRDDRC